MLILLLQCIIVSCAFIIAFEISVNSIIPILFGIIYGIVIKCRSKREWMKKEKISIFILSTIFTLFLIMAQVETVLGYENNILCICSLFVSTVGLFIFFKVIIEQIVLFWLKDVLQKNSGNYCVKPAYVFWGSLVILLLSWGVNFLFDFPGIICVDTIENLEQAVGTRAMDVLFPFYMTLYLRFCWNIGLCIWGSGNAGIGLYCGSQMILLSLAVSYMIYRIYKCNISISVCAVFLLYFALVPYHAHSGYVLLKDTPYAIGTMLFILMLWEYYIYGEAIKNNILRIIVVVLAGTLMAVSRANGYYVLLFCLPFLVYIFYKKQRNVVLVIGLAFIIITFVRGAVFDYVITQNNKYIVNKDIPIFDVRYHNTTHDDTEENLDKADWENIEVTAENGANIAPVGNASSNYGASGVFIITAQQLGRVAVDRELTEEEYEHLSTVINVEGMRETYNNQITTNAMKQIINSNTKEYLSVWLEFGIKFPYTYFIAWRDQTQGYWNPNVFTGEYDLDFCERNPEVYRDSLFPETLVSFKDSIYEKMLTKCPIVPLFFSNGVFVWITFFAICLTAIKRNWTTIFLYTPLIGLWLTLLVANPCNGELRYMYSFFLCLPISLVIPFVRGAAEEL